jgi:tetratricopeptide (TPR) repeat protein
MGLFDKLTNKSRKEDCDLKWLDEQQRKLWVECDRGMSQSGGTDAASVRATVDSMLVDDVKGLKKNFMALASAFMLANHGPGFESSRPGVGLIWCDVCKHPSVVICVPVPGMTNACSLCKRKSSVAFLKYSLDVGKQIRKLFDLQWSYIDLMERGDDQLDTHRNPNDALALYSQAHERALELDSARGQAAALCAMGDAQCDLQQHDTAISLFLEAQQLAQKIGDRLNLAKSLTGRARVYIGQSEFGWAFALYERAQDICAREKNRPDFALHLSLVFMQKALLACGRIETLEKARDFAVEHREVIRELYSSLAAKGIPPLLISENQAVEHVERVIQESGYQPDLVTRANEAWASGDKVRQLKALQEVEKILLKIRDLSSLKNCLSNQLPLLMEARDIEHVFRVCELLENIARKRRDKRSLVTALQNQAELLKLTEDARVSSKEEEARRLGEEVKAAEEEMSLLERQVEAAVKAKNWAQVREWTKCQLSLARSLDESAQFGPIIHRLAETELSLGNVPAACIAFEQLEGVGRDINNPYLVVVGQSGQGKCLEQSGDWEAAFGCYRRAASEVEDLVVQSRADHSAQSQEPFMLLLEQRRSYVSSIRRLGDSRAKAMDFDNAMLVYRTLMELCARMLSHSPADHQLKLSHIAVTDELGVTLLKGPSPSRKEGLALVQSAMNMLDQLDHDDPANQSSRAKVRVEISSHLRM